MTYVCMYVCMYVYIERERDDADRTTNERKTETNQNITVSACAKCGSGALLARAWRHAAGVSYAVARPLRQGRSLYIPQRRVQWKQGVVIYMTLYTSLLYNTTPIHCTPDPLHPPLQSIHSHPLTGLEHFVVRRCPHPKRVPIRGAIQYVVIL